MDESLTLKFRRFVNWTIFSLIEQNAENTNVLVNY